MGAVRCTPRPAERHRRPDGRAADVSAVAARRSLGAGAQPHVDGGAVEPRDARVRPRQELSSRCSWRGSSSASARPLTAASASPSLLSVFPARLRATLTGAFMAGGMFGSVLGHGGRRRPRGAVRLALVVRRHGDLRTGARRALSDDRARVSRFAGENRTQAQRAATHVQTPNARFRSPLATVFATRSVISAYVGSGLQLFIGGSLIAWMPSYLNRYYGMSADRAGVASAAFVLCSGAGMILCGMHQRPVRQALAAAQAVFRDRFVSACFVLLSVAFQHARRCAPARDDRLGMFVAAGTAGPAGAMVANLTHCRDSRHGVRDADARKQSAGPRARTLRHRRAGRSSGLASARCS